MIELLASAKVPDGGYYVMVLAPMVFLALLVFVGIVSTAWIWWQERQGR